MIDGAESRCTPVTRGWRSALSVEHGGDGPKEAFSDVSIVAKAASRASLFNTRENVRGCAPRHGPSRVISLLSLISRRCASWDS